MSAVSTRNRWRCPGCNEMQDGPVTVRLKHSMAWLQCPDCKLYSKHVRFTEGWKWAGITASHPDIITKLEEKRDE